MPKHAVSLALALILLTPAVAGAHHKRGPCQVHWQKPWVQHHDTRPVADLIRCAARRWSVPGGVSKALSVAACESGRRPDATNTPYLGVYQHASYYWPARASKFLRPRWGIRHGIFNARAQAIVSIRMAHSMGSWWPWSCA